MKLTDVRLVGHFGDHPSLFADPPRADGSRSYFPHVHIGADVCARPRYYEPASSSHYRGEEGYVRHLEKELHRTITVNEGGDYECTHEWCDALTDLWASAPELLRLLKALVDNAEGNWTELGGARVSVESVRHHAKTLVDRLLAHEVERRGPGWGQSFNADGTPYVEDEGGAR